jgi:hypothetical protein
MVPPDDQEVAVVWKRIRTVVAALGATIALGALAGCGGGGGGNGVASLGGQSAQEAGSDGSNKVSDRERDAAFRKFTQCMREHGVDMPDPEVADDGSFTMQAPVVAESSDGSVQPPAGFREANEACQKYLEGVVNGGDEDGPSAEEIEKIQRQALKFARCMRAEGIDFPDPEFGSGGGGGGMVMIGGPGEGIDPTDPTVSAAMEKCSKDVGMPKPRKGDVVSGDGGAGLTVRGGGTK